MMVLRILSQAQAPPSGCQVSDGTDSDTMPSGLAQGGGSGAELSPSLGCQGLAPSRLN